MRYTTIITEELHMIVVTLMLGFYEFYNLVDCQTEQ
jgi:hypothetical protein